LLFQGEEITRDIFFLDAAIEYGVVDLGANPIQDLAFYKYSSLNLWFHYRFFNGIAPIIYSSEALTLLPRLFRLKRVLLQSTLNSSLAGYYQQEFAVAEPQKLVQSVVKGVSKLIEISAQHNLLAWGVSLDAASVVEQTRYLSEVLARVPTDLILDLPHVRQHAQEWKRVLKEEATELRKAEAEFNKVVKRQRRFQHLSSPRGQ
jgi:hypothetical protein